MYFGCNQNHYPEVNAGISGKITMLRAYQSLASWPPMPGGLPSLWSPRPDPAQLLAGKLDNVVKVALDTAPPGSMLSFWHEANQSNQSAATMQKMHAYAHNLVHNHTADVKYGVILTQGAAATWAVSGLDFYGIDMYDLNEVANPLLTLDRFDQRMPAGPRLIAETNSSVVTHRPAWFRTAFDWLYYHKGLALLTFWLPGGPLSGPWVNDAATIYTLNRIAADAAR